MANVLEDGWYKSNLSSIFLQGARPNNWLATHDGDGDEPSPKTHRPGLVTLL